ncbi:MAG: DUF2934 domain-containing protein [Pseudomonadota bacterium]
MHSTQDREAMIREAAYYRYLNHGCSDGHDLEDWLAAEAELDAGIKSAPSPSRLKAPRAGLSTGEKSKRTAVIKGAVHKPDHHDNSGH